MRSPSFVVRKLARVTALRDKRVATPRAPRAAKRLEIYGLAVCKTLASKEREGYGGPCDVSSLSLSLGKKFSTLQIHYNLFKRRRSGSGSCDGGRSSCRSATMFSFIDCTGASWNSMAPPYFSGFFTTKP